MALRIICNFCKALLTGYYNIAAFRLMVLMPITVKLFIARNRV